MTTKKEKVLIALLYILSIVAALILGAVQTENDVILYGGSGGSVSFYTGHDTTDGKNAVESCTDSELSADL